MNKQCACKSIPEDELKRIKDELPDSDTIESLGEFFKVFGDPTRLKLLYFLSQYELCVADLAKLSEMEQSAVSHQLKILRLHRLAKQRRDGTTIYYSLNDNHVREVFDVALEHIEEIG